MATEPLKVIGQPLNRVEGRAKVTGRATYAADHFPPRLAHAVGVFTPVAAGTVEAIDTAACERSAGVLAVLHRGNLPRLFRSPNEMEAGNRVSEIRPPLSDDVIGYAGQFVAFVVAERFEQARTAARLVRVRCAAAPPILGIDAAIRAQAPEAKEDTPDYRRGDAEGAWASAPVKVDVTYDLPVEVHVPMELHATVAAWEGARLTLYDSTQWVVGQRKALAKVLGIADEDITVHAAYIGGGFGGKLFLWPHTTLTAVAARQLGRPVKFMLERRNSFTSVGHRPATRQRFRLGAKPDGELVAVSHDTLSQSSLGKEFLENCGSATRSLYRCAHVAVTHRLALANVGAPTAMRAPGSASGLAGLEAALDELAIALHLDPVALRRRNLPERDEQKRLPWSGCHLEECLRQVTERFGWARRNPEPGAMRDGEEILGWGFATASWPAEREKAQARVELRADGTARAMCATQDIGTGTYTVIGQMVSEVTGLPLDRIDVSIGSSAFPEGPISGGSMATATVSPAIMEAAVNAGRSLCRAATRAGGPFAGAQADHLQFRDGAVCAPEGRRAGIEKVLAAAHLASVDGDGRSEPGPEEKQYSFRAFGAHAVEVRWDPSLARLRVARVVSAFDVGRVINRKTATNQIRGAILMGVGMALLEESVYDPRTGRVVTDNLADYHVAVNADTPEMDVTFLDIPDPQIGGYGARGLGEIGITGLAAAIVNAVHHATGRRIRQLPIKIEQLIA